MNKSKTRVRRPVCSVQDALQMGLFSDGCAVPGSTPGSRRSTGIVGFIDPSPFTLTIGALSLEEYLSSMGLEWVFRVRQLLREQDWVPFESAYKLSGRRPYAPAVMVGLVLYGVMEGKSSLRELEQLAKKDVGAMWLTGGSCPDHTTLCRFLQLHSERLTTDFFEGLTRSVLKASKSRSRVFSGDGTVVEAAASRFSRLKHEAALAQAKEARKRANEKPNDRKRQEVAARKEVVATAAETRASKRKGRGASGAATQVCPSEPEAAVLKTKRGVCLPGYVPSLIVSSDRLIVAQHVDSVSEQASLPPMVNQMKRVVDPLGTEKELTLLLDGGYHCGPTAQLGVEEELNLLCPSPAKFKKKEKFRKEDFRYDEARNVYICPQGQLLRTTGRAQRDKRRNIDYLSYRCSIPICRACPVRDRCIPSEKTPRRTITRFEHDEAREALVEVMKQPRAKALYAHRKGMVEPVFGELRQVQNLGKFRRFGIIGARLEFALHACAHNLRRFVLWGAAARRRLGAHFFFFFVLCGIQRASQLAPERPHRRHRPPKPQNTPLRRPPTRPLLGHPNFRTHLPLVA